MPVKIAVKVSKVGVSQQSTAMPTSKDNAQTTSRMRSDAQPDSKSSGSGENLSDKPTVGVAAQAIRVARQEEKMPIDNVRESPAQIQTQQRMLGVQESISKGTSVSIKDAAEAADIVIKNVTGMRSDKIVGGSTQREDVSLSLSRTPKLERSPGKRQPASSRSSERTTAHRSDAAVRNRPTSQTVSNASTADRFDFVSDYGLFLLRPEIITLYDSDPELNQSNELTEAYDFANLQRATSKSLQERSYRRARDLLSSLPSNPAIPFNPDDLGPLNRTTALEDTSTSVFEQAVARWDEERLKVTEEENDAASRAIVAQDLVSALDIVNTPFSFEKTIGSDVCLESVVKRAIANVDSSPTADPFLVAGRYYNRHLFLHDMGSLNGWIESLLYPADIDDAAGNPLVVGSMPARTSRRSLGLGSGLGVQSADSDPSTAGRNVSREYRTYSFMHTLLQNTFLCFAFGSPRLSIGRGSISRTRGTGLHNTYVAKLAENQYGKIAGNQLFLRPASLANNAREIDSPSVAASMFAKLTAIAAYRSSHLYDPEKTALEIFQEKIGLPVSFNSRDASGTAFADFEQAPAGSLANLLFQIRNQDDGKHVVFFDRNRNPGLPSNYTHGYPKIFGTSTTSRDTLEDLSSRISDSLTMIDDLSSVFFTSNAGVRGAAESATSSERKISEVGQILLEKFAELLRPISQDSTEGIADFQRDYAYNEYKKYIDLYAGTGGDVSTIPVRPYTTIADLPGYPFGAGTTVGETAKTLLYYSKDQGNLSSFPVFSVLELLLLLSTGNNTVRTVPESSWSGLDRARSLVDYMIGRLMAYWEQYFDFLVGERDEITIRFDDWKSEANESLNFEYSYPEDSIRILLQDYFGFWTSTYSLETFAETCMRKIVDWSIETARLMFPSEGKFQGSNASSEKISSLFEFTVTRTTGPESSKTHTFKEICYFITVFGSYYARDIFAQPRMPIDLDVYKTLNGNISQLRELGTGFQLLTEFKRSANTAINSVTSQTPQSFDDARLCLEVVSEQLKAVNAKIEKITTYNSPYYVDRKFNILYTPMQAAGVTLRKAEFLERSAKSPFQSRRYDEMISVRSLERSAINALYRSELMKQDDTKVLFVGLPTGIQHSVGINQHFVKITVARKDSGYGTAYEPLVFYFDMFKFCSTELCAASQVTPWTVKSEGNIEEAISDLSLFTIDLKGTRSYGNYALSDQSFRVGDSRVGFVQVGHITRPTLDTPAGADSRKVLVSDITVSCEFMDANAAAADLGASLRFVDRSPKIHGNHLVDLLLRTHVRRMSGLDLSETIFTTSTRAFSSSTTTGLSDIGQYVFDLCATSIIGGQKNTDPGSVAADVKTLEILARSPLTRADSYADLCMKPTYFDRVFAMPINLRQFRVM